MKTPLEKIDYQKKMDQYISQLCNKPSLLLHSCCAPCSSYVLTYLMDYFNITVFFYNPNITSEEEYKKRLEEQKRLIDLLNNENNCNINMICGGYEKDLFFEKTEGMENLSEGGKRCQTCFSLRMDETARVCKEHQFDLFATTLTLSPHKNANLVNSAGESAAEKYHCNYLASDFKKKNGYKISIELSKKYNLYRQNYCGCVFSKREDMQ